MNHLNYNFNSSSRNGTIVSVTDIRKQIKNPDGSVSIVSIKKHENPFEGLSADSFKLQSQIDAGVRLQPSPKNSSVSVYKVDSVINQVNTVIDANKKGIKLNSKNSK